MIIISVVLIAGIVVLYFLGKKAQKKQDEQKKQQEQERALRIFEGFPAPRLGYDQITGKYQDAEAVRAQLTALKAQWPALKERLQGQVYSYEKMKALLKAAGAPYEPEHIGVSRQQLHDMFPKVQLMRARFNVLDLAMRGGFYEALVEPPFAPGGPFALA